MAKEDNEGEKDMESLGGMVLSSKVRRRILRSLLERERRFSDLLQKTQTTHGNLNYHLISMRSVGLLMKQRNVYALSRLGKKVARRYLEK